VELADNGVNAHGCGRRERYEWRGNDLKEKHAWYRRRHCNGKPLGSETPRRMRSGQQAEHKANENGPEIREQRCDVREQLHVRPNV
jgi:hypothetical protein